MDPILAAGIAQIGISFIGEYLASAQDEREYEQRMAALREYAALQPPAHRELVAREVRRSQLQDVRRDPALEATQDEVLSRLMEVGRGGESAQARAEYEQAAQESSMLERAARAYALQQAQAAGLGPDAAYQDALMAAQEGAGRERMAGLQRAAMGEQFRMGALGQAGSMAERRSASRWAQDAEAARAQDELNLFNTGQWNEMARFNRGDELDVFNQQLALADRRAGARGDIGDMYARRGARTRQRAGDIATGTGRAIMAPYVYGAPPAGAAPSHTPQVFQGATAAGAAAPMQPVVAQQQQIQAPTRAALPYDDPRRRRLR